MLRDEEWQVTYVIRGSGQLPWEQIEALGGVKDTGDPWLLSVSECIDQAWRGVSFFVEGKDKGRLLLAVERRGPHSWWVERSGEVDLIALAEVTSP